MVPVLLVTLLGAAFAGAGGPAGGVAPPPASAWLGAGQPVQEASLCVVANVPEDAANVDLDFVRRIFLVRQRFWPDGGAAHPVNLPASSEARERFSLEVFGETVTDMVPYWNDRYFHGTRPPRTVASEAAVLLFVARTPGGVGYVSQPLTRDLPAGVREVLCLPTAVTR